MNFNCSPESIDRLKIILKKNEKFLISVNGSGGCVGHTYEMKIIVGDAPFAVQEFLFHDIIILIPVKVLKYFNNATLNFTSSLKENKFVIENPNVIKDCSCGNSIVFKENL